MKFIYYHNHNLIVIIKGNRSYLAGNFSLPESILSEDINKMNISSDWYLSLGVKNITTVYNGQRIYNAAKKYCIMKNC